MAIVGVGNCASSFVQGVEYYKDADPTQSVPGLMHVDLGGYHVNDIEFTAAFDIDADKVGKDLSEAIWAGQNNTIKFADVPHLNVPVYRGMTHDGLGKYLKQRITKAPGETDDIVGILKDTHTDVVVSYLGRLRAGDQVVRGADPRGRLRLRELHPGVHRQGELLGQPLQGRRACRSSAMTSSRRSAPRSSTASWRVRSTSAACSSSTLSQLNVGGNMDFFNMLERERLESKKISKTQAVTSVMGLELPADDVHVGPSTTCRG